MTTPVLIAVFFFAALLLQTAWHLVERRRETRASARLAELESMGDVIPDSIHPTIDPNACIGSGSCVRACPEKNVIAVTGGLARLTNPLACVGHGACEKACPMRAITLVFGTAKRGVELPRIDANFETTRPGVYVIGELGGMGLIRNAVRQGSEAADHVIAGARRGAGDALDALVVGAGPAGIAATLRLMEGGLRVLLVDRERFGGTIQHYPRAKVVMTGALDLPKYGKVRQRKMSKEELVALWEDIRRKADPPVVEGELVEGIEATPDGMWAVRSEGGGTRRAANVLLALGRRGSPRKLGVPGEELAKVAYRLLEPREFQGRHVLVVGGGNSAVESALALVDHGACASVAISYRRASFDRCRGDNRARIERAIAEGKVEALLPSTVVSIDERAVLLRGDDGRQWSRPNDAVIVQIGGTPPGQILGAFDVETVTKFGEA